MKKKNQGPQKPGCSGKPEATQYISLASGPECGGTAGRPWVATLVFPGGMCPPNASSCQGLAERMALKLCRSHTQTHHNKQKSNAPPVPEFTAATDRTCLRCLAERYVSSKCRKRVNGVIHHSTTQQTNLAIRMCQSATSWPLPCAM